MELPEAMERALLGESLHQLSVAYRDELLRDLGLDPEEARPTTFRKETQAFMGKLCRLLSERYGHDSRVETALSDYVLLVDDYDAYDSLLSTFERFGGREAIVRRGKKLFPGPLTSHWDE